VPGERLGRFTLPPTIFGAALLPAGRGIHKGAGPVLARLMVMPASGGPRIYTLHHPKYTPLRHRNFRRLLEAWLDRLRNPGDPRVRGYLLRQLETTFSAVPELPSILVRWLLPYDPAEPPWEERMPGDALEPSYQWLPRHLRPLVDLDRAWRGEEPLRGRLKAALLAAREIGDRHLFKEILEAALSRANHQLYAEATAGGELPFAAKFGELLADLEEVKGAWQGEPANLDVRVRITIAKSLLDGDTLWSLAQAAGRQAGGAGFQKKKKEDAVTRAMKARVRLVHRSLGKGDLLLALETLRAANLGLLRLCRRLVRGRRENWSTHRPEREVRWEALRGFFAAVGDFAARVAHPRGNLGEVARHEICRAYALGMLACPSEIVRLAIWVSEADLPIDIGQQVEEQLDLLHSLLGDFPRLPLPHRVLLRIALHTFRGGDYRQALFFPREKKRAWITDARWVGNGNVEMVRARRPFDDVIVWLHDLARQLADDAGSVDLQAHDELYRRIDAIEGETREQFKHSIQFWTGALAELGGECKGFEHLFASTRQTGLASRDGDFPFQPVRPELVLFSGALADWCQRQRAEIQVRRTSYRLFEPVSSLYDEAFALVERTARRFRQGAAVQKNLVLGVLGHGLLELLEEHLLEVWEVAQALDPRRVWDQDDRAGDGHPGYRLPPAQGATSTAARFADYLLQRALKAEVIPKNLRSLQGLLSFTKEEPKPMKLPKPKLEPRLTLKSLVQEIGVYWDVDPLLADEPLDQRTYHFLHLTLSELEQNDRMHGEPASSKGTRLEAAKPRVWSDRSPSTLWLEFRYPKENKKAFKR
ncbi:MAG TPA: hypothetical protein VGR07_01680, partial [Thermoanaerobaculia bacterium]|nr:hypothetical protein [Thermoanaerobaculia bacterium]